MTNHVHAVIGFHKTRKTINSTGGNGKRFMAYNIVEHLQKLNCPDILLQVGGVVNDTQKASVK